MKNQTTFRPSYLLFLVLINLHLTSGCEKEEQWMDAIVLDFGSPTVDGCGFVIEVECIACISTWYLLDFK